MPQKKYSFPIQTSQGPGVVEVPLEDFKVCPCGHNLFRRVHLVTWVKRMNELGATPVRFVADVFLCEECGREIGPVD